MRRTFLLAGLGLAALMQTWRNLVGLHIRSVEAPPVFCGSQAAFTLKLENSYPSVRPAIGARFHRHTDARRGTVDLPSRQARNVIASITAHRRGRLRPGRIVLETSYPLGMFRAWTFVDTATSCLIYPRPADITGGLDADADSQGARTPSRQARASICPRPIPRSAPTPLRASASDSRP